LARSVGLPNHAGKSSTPQVAGTRTTTIIGTTPIAAPATRVLDRIPFRIALADVAQHSHGAGAGEDADDLARLIDEAHGIGRPRALYAVSFAGERGDDWVDLDGVRFASRVLRINLESTYRVFPYVVTSGVELHDWTLSQPELLWEYWAQVISEMALRQAAQAFHQLP